MDVEYIVIYALVGLAFAGFLTATLSYWIMAPWHKTRIGRNFMFLLLNMTFALALTLSGKAFSHEVGLALAVIVYGLFSASGVGFAVAILKEQWGNKRRANAKDDHPGG